MRRHAGGRRCGARADASHASVREAPGSRPLQLRGAALRGCTRRGRRRAKARRIGLSQKPPGSAPGSYGPGDRKAAMERREAPAFLATGTRQDGRRQRRSVLHPLIFEGPAKTGDPGASTKNSGDDAWLFENRICSNPVVRANAAAAISAPARHRPPPSPPPRPPAAKPSAWRCARRQAGLRRLASRPRRLPSGRSRSCPKRRRPPAGGC